jgi:hypothetical protein
MDRAIGRAMRASVIQTGQLAGVRKATVSRFEHRVTSWGEAIRGRLVNEWLASHDCGWWESLTEWHNALWAADHHVRHDCGRREQPSSGTVRHYGRDYHLFAPEAAYEGGMQKTPTPTHMGFPLGREYPEQPTTAGDIYLGRDVPGQGYTEGGVAGEQGLGQGSTRGHGDGTGWWPWGGRTR